jgi:hypothetical protein
MNSQTQFVKNQKITLFMGRKVVAANCYGGKGLVVNDNDSQSIDL